jgi:hypothetical protein
MGGSGTNDLGHAFSVASIGIREASDITYEAELHMNGYTDYNGMRHLTIEAARSLYGDCSTEVESVIRAWFAVGVGSDYPATGVTSTLNLFFPISVSVIKEAVYINGYNEIVPGVDVEYRAKNSVTLLPRYSPGPGFTADYGSVFLADIDPCTTIIEFKHSNTSSTQNNNGNSNNIFNDESIGLFPNPTQNNITISYPCKSAGQLSISIKDVAGRVRYTENVTCTEGNNVQHLVDMSSLSAGVYFVDLTLNEQHVVKKVVKL